MFRTSPGIDFPQTTTLQSIDHKNNFYSLVNRYGDVLTSTQLTKQMQCVLCIFRRTLETKKRKSRKYMYDLQKNTIIALFFSYASSFSYMQLETTALVTKCPLLACVYLVKNYCQPFRFSLFFEIFINNDFETSQILSQYHTSQSN